MRIIEDNFHPKDNDGNVKANVCELTVVCNGCHSIFVICPEDVTICTEIVMDVLEYATEKETKSFYCPLCKHETILLTDF